MNQGKEDRQGMVVCHVSLHVHQGSLDCLGEGEEEG